VALGVRGLEFSPVPASCADISPGGVLSHATCKPVSQDVSVALIVNPKSETGPSAGFTSAMTHGAHVPDE